MANILDTYGIKEVADVTMYEILEPTDAEYNTYGQYKPVLFLDTLKVSTIAQTASQTSARGGKGNAELIVWDYGKEITVTLEDALFSPKSMNIMLGGMEAGKLAATTAVTSINRMTKFEVKETTTVPADEKWYSTADFSPLTTGASVQAGTFVYREKAYAVSGNTIEITAANFPGTYRLVGETYSRSQKTGKDEFFQFEIPKAKMGAENTITLQAEGDPSVFNMTMKVLRPDDGVMMKLTQFNLDESGNASNPTTPTTFTVTYKVVNKDGSDYTSVDNDPATETVNSGSAITQTGDWFTDQECTTAYTATSVTADITLYKKGTGWD